MRPEDVRVWRKGRRAIWKGRERGRRSTHLVRTQPPRPGSTWTRRHPEAPLTRAVRNCSICGGVYIGSHCANCGWW